MVKTMLSIVTRSALLRKIFTITIQAFNMALWKILSAGLSNFNIQKNVSSIELTFFVLFHFKSHSADIFKFRFIKTLFQIDWKIKRTGRNNPPRFYHFAFFMEFMNQPFYRFGRMSHDFARPSFFNDFTVEFKRPFNII